MTKQLAVQRRFVLSSLSIGRPCIISSGPPRMHAASRRQEASSRTDDSILIFEVLEESLQ
jgi:hypothetical protein